MENITKTIKYVCWQFLNKNFEKNWKAYRQLQLTVKMFAKFSLKRSWQTFFIVFCWIFQLVKKIFCKTKKLSYMNFYRNSVTWFRWSMTLREYVNFWKIYVHALSIFITFQTFFNTQVIFKLNNILASQISFEVSFRQLSTEWFTHPANRTI